MSDGIVILNAPETLASCQPNGMEVGCDGAVEGIEAEGKAEQDAAQSNAPARIAEWVALAIS
jgi:hypothetical protein